LPISGGAIRIARRGHARNVVDWMKGSTGFGTTRLCVTARE
jgi:hypothetical protein